MADKYTTFTYQYEDLADVKVQGFDGVKLGWKLADIFPTKEYTAAVNKYGKDKVQRDEDYADCIDSTAFKLAPIRFKLVITDEWGEYETDIIEIPLHARTEDEIDAITSTIGGSVDFKTEIANSAK